jgi:MFS family permease
MQARLNERVEGRRLVRTGLLVIIAAIGGMALILLPGVPVAAGIAAWTVGGLGMGLAYAPISLMMLREAPPGREGWASASLNLTDVLGTAVGIGIGGAAVAATVRSGESVALGVAFAFAAAAAVGVAALAVTRRLPAVRDPSARDPSVRDHPSREVTGEAELPHGLAVGDGDGVELKVQLGRQVERDALGPL